MNRESLIKYAREQAKARPDLSDEIGDLLDLALWEIDDGGSEQHETELAYNDIKFLVNGN